MKRTKKIKGSALVAALVAMLVLGAFGISLASIVSGQLEGGIDQLQAAQAFYVAEGGMQVVLMNELSGDSNFADNLSPTDPPFGANAIGLGPGQFWIEYLNQLNASVIVRVTSRVQNAVRVVQQSVGQGGSGFQYVTVAGGNLNVNSTDGDIYGDLGLHGNASIDDDVTVHGNMIEDPNLVIPTVDFPTYEAMCDATHTGNLTISADYTGDLCVTGNVTLNGSITFTGLLYAEGNVSIGGHHVTVNGSVVTEANFTNTQYDDLDVTAPSSGPDQHMPAILAGGNLDNRGADHSDFQGVLWAGGNIDMTNTDFLNFTGTFFSGGNMILNSIDQLNLNFDADLLVGVPGLQGGNGNNSGSLSLSSWQTY